MAGITTPQTIKIEGQIKKKKVIVLIDSGSTHNFIHCKIAKELNCFLYLTPERQVIVASGGTINFNGLEEITTPQTLEIEGHIKKEKVQAVKDHIEHQQQVLQLLKDNTISVQNQTKQ